MMTITVEHETDTAHRLSCHKGKCANLHGHRYKFVVSIEAKGTIESDEFVDFYTLKRAVRDELDALFDHGTILKTCPENEPLIAVLKAMQNKMILMSYEPTVEAMTEWLSTRLNRLSGLEGRLVQLTIYETPTNYCTWTRKTKCGCAKEVKDEVSNS